MSSQNLNNKERLVIECEVCRNCKNHSWNTHHKEERYEEIFNSLKQQI